MDSQPLDPQGSPSFNFSKRRLGSSGRNQTWVHSPAGNKGNAQTPRRVQRVSQDSKQGVQEASAQRPQLLDGFQGKVFKDRVREGDCGVHDQLVDSLPIGGW